MKARVLSACVFVPVILGSALIGGWVFLAIVLVICGISAWEFGRLFDQHDGMRIPLTVLIISVLGENEKLDAILASLRPAAK